MLSPEEDIDAANVAADAAAVANAWANPPMPDATGLPMGDEEAEAMAASVMPDISSSSTPPSPTTNTKKKRGKKKATFKKNPYAPKRFKSSYICFFTSSRPDIKKELGEALGREATIAEVAKKAAEQWRNMTQDDKLKWDEIAAKDKQRYLTEKALYTGEWRVAKKKSKKDSRAPKRSASAFLYFSGDRRGAIKESNPDLSNTDVSKELGRMWREMSETEKKPYVEQEKEEREKYMEEMAHYKAQIAEEEAREKKKKDDEQREFQEKVQQQLKMQEEYAHKGGYNAMLYAGAYGVGTTAAASGNDTAEPSEASTAAAAASAAAAAAASANYYGYAPYPYYYPPSDGSNAVAAQAFAGAYAYPAAQQVQVVPGQYQPLTAGPPAYQGGAPQVLGPSGMPQAHQAAYAYPGVAASPEEEAAAQQGGAAPAGGEGDGAAAYGGQFNV